MLADLELELDQRVAGGCRNDSMMSCRQQPLKTKFPKHGSSYLCVPLCKYFLEFEIVGWRLKNRFSRTSAPPLIHPSDRFDIGGTISGLRRLACP
jgi:hypothetical protein